MTKKYEVVLFTDMSARIYPARPLGAYRLATELRQHNLNVLVVNFFGKWIQNPNDFETLIKNCISEQTCVVGFSSTFFSEEHVEKQSISSYEDFIGNHLSHWPDSNINKIKSIIGRIKKLNNKVKIFYGGAQADKINDNLINIGIDYIVQGLADYSFIESVLRIKDNKQPKFNIKNNIKVIDYDVKARLFSFPNSSVSYHDSDFIEKNEVLTLETSRGCLFHCAFCSFPLIGRNKNHIDYHKNTDQIANEIKNNYEKWGTTKYIIVDDTFNESTEKINNVYNAIKQSNVDIEFSAYLRLDLLERFPQQVQLLKDMGLRSAFLGIETLNEKAGKSIGKNSYRVIDELERIRDIWKEDVSIYGSLIAGLPYENQDTINEWMQIIYDREHLLELYVLGALGIDQSSSFKSKISQNPEKYGYTFDMYGNWTNNVDFTLNEAKDISQDWMTKGWQNSRFKLAGSDLMGIQSLGFSFDQIKKWQLNNIDYCALELKYGEIVSSYKNSLLKYLTL